MTKAVDGSAAMHCSTCGRDVTPVEREGVPYCPECGACLAIVGSGQEKRRSVEELLESAGPYEVRERIASGGMGSVYRAHDTKLDREVAIKVLLAGSGATEEDVQRFRREAAAAARLRHSNIVSIHNVGEVGGYPYIVMDYVDGDNLADLIEANAVSPRRALDITEQIADALHYAHLRGVVHRDLKPANILIDSLGRAQLTDFGLAKRLDEKLHLTRTGTTMGTPAYMAPEQAEGLLEEIDAQSDVYGLGAVLYEMLTGRPPFLGDNTMKVLIDVIEEDPPSPRSLNPRINSDIETICLTAMAKSKRQRYATALALADDIRRFKRGEAIEARPAGFFSRAARRIARSWAVVLAVVVALAAVGIAGGYFYYVARSGEKQARLERVKKARESLVRSKDFLNAGDDKSALDAAQEAKVLSPDLPEADEAIESAKRVGRIRKAERYLEFARSFMSSGKYDSAEAMFDLVLTEFDPGNSEAVTGLRLARGTGKLSVKTVPDGAAVAVIPVGKADAISLGNTPISGVDIEMGRYCLRLEPPNLSPQEISFEVGRSEVVALSFDLPPKGVPADMVPVKRKADTGAIFYIDRYEFPNRWNVAPRVGISYLEAQAACTKAGKHLCSYAEWHFACAGEDQRQYPYGDRFKDDRCNTGSGSGGAAAPAGAFPQCVSAFGVFDMSGNVAEWVTVPPDGVFAAGGSWTQSLAPSLSCTATQFHDPAKGWDRVGFRCCLDGPARSVLAQIAESSTAPPEVAADTTAPQHPLPSAGGSTAVSCPEGMVPVETGLCVDRYEYPNRAGEVPRALVSWIEAQALCKKSGKRLCTFAEWQLACGGPGHWKYPYGNTFRKGTCRDGLDRFTDGPAASGSLGLCVSAYGAFDMTGNLSEWVADDAGEGFKTFVGGSFASDPQEASCTASLGNLSDSKSRHIGFRCCVDLTAPQK